MHKFKNSPLSVILTLLTCIPLLAQNLVPNGSFEVIARCPGGHSINASDFKVADWYSPSQGTPDYFNACSKGDSGVPYNWAGVSNAFDGHGYAGIYVYRHGSHYREYLACRLTVPLVKDAVYVLSFRYRLSSYSRYLVNSIGFALAGDSIFHDGSDEVLKEFSGNRVADDAVLTREAGTWQFAEFTVVASGGERYLVLGNMNDNRAVAGVLLHFPGGDQPMLEGSAYYYIDDVRLSPAWSDTSPPSPVDTLALDRRYTLTSVLFDFDSDQLRAVAAHELDGLANWLIAHPDVHATISGYTDDVGGQRYNQKLSERRAESVARYLIAKGVARGRVSTHGYGSDQPLSDSNVRNRENDRRVEFVLRRD